MYPIFFLSLSVSPGQVFLSARCFSLPGVSPCQVFLSARCFSLPGVSLCQVFLSARCFSLPGVSPCQVFLSARCFSLPGVSLYQVFLSARCFFLPLLLFPWWFHVSACRDMFVAGFLNVCLIHLHFLFVISCSTGSCLVLSQSAVLDSLLEHFRCQVLRRHLLMKV